MPGSKAPEEERRNQILGAAQEVASRETLGGLTIRGVAEAAGLSVGLVHFHFKSRELLLMALLDRLLEQTLAESVEAIEAAADPSPRETIRKLLQREIGGLPGKRDRVELFFDFWVMGTRHPEIRSRVRASLERYRRLIGEITTPLVLSRDTAFGGMTPEGLAAVAVSFIEGCALQAVIDPASFDLAAYLESVDALLESVVHSA